MKVDSTTLNQAVLGIQQGMQDLNKHANKIAQEITNANQMSPGGGTDIAKPLVSLSQDQLQVAASAKVAATADQMIGSLFDQKA